MSRPVVLFDIEVYRNFFLVCFRELEGGNTHAFEFPYTEEQATQIRELVASHRLVGFNSTNFDLGLLLFSLTGRATLETLKEACNNVIVQGMQPWTFADTYGIHPDDPRIDHVDIMAVAPLTASLKAYAARLHAASIQDLPLAPDALVPPEMIPVLREYCQGDLVNTELLYKALLPQLELREAMTAQYGLDLRSKSDAQIAEAVIKKEVESKRGHGFTLRRPDDTVRNDFTYTVPVWMDFRLPELQVLLEQVRKATFVVSEKGGVLMPASLKTGKEASVWIAGKEYRMGVGGLHSCESAQVVEADADHLVMDFDVQAYYPSIILTLGLYPAHIGPAFLEVYRALVDKRVAAKLRAGELKKEIAKIKQEVCTMSGISKQ